MAERIEVDSSDRVSASGGTDGPGWGRRMITLLVAIAAIGGFAMIVVYSYDQDDKGATGKKAPVITAQSGPTKVRPESPGGMAVPNRDKQVYGQLDTAKRPESVERLLPPPEPVAPKPAAEPAMAADDAAKSAMEKEQANIARQLSTLAPAAGGTDTAAPPPPPQVAAVPPAPMAKAEPKDMPMPAPAEESKAMTPSKPAKMTGAYRVQIAALRSEDAAKKAWSRLSKGNKDLFGKLEPNIEKIELAGKGTFYRLQAGPLDGASQAKSLCSSLKKRKIGCLVVRP